VDGAAAAEKNLVMVRKRLAAWRAAGLERHSLESAWKPPGEAQRVAVLALTKELKSKTLVRSVPDGAEVLGLVDGVFTRHLVQADGTVTLLETDDKGVRRQRAGNIVMTIAFVLLASAVIALIVGHILGHVRGDRLPGWNFALWMGGIVLVFVGTCLAPTLNQRAQKGERWHLEGSGWRD
jgi:hypothetical protein